MIEISLNNILEGSTIDDLCRKLQDIKKQYPDKKFIIEDIGCVGDTYFSLNEVE